MDSTTPVIKSPTTTTSTTTPPGSSSPSALAATSSSPEASRNTTNTTPNSTPPNSPLKRKRSVEDVEEFPKSEKRSPSPVPSTPKSPLPPTSLLPQTSPVLPASLSPATPVSPKSPKRSREALEANEKASTRKRAKSEESEPKAKQKEAFSSSAPTSPRLPSAATVSAAATVAKDEEMSRTASPESTPNPLLLRLQTDLAPLDIVKLGEVLEEEGEEDKLETDLAALSNGLEVDFAVDAEKAAGVEPSAEDLRAMAASVPETKRNLAGMEALGMHNPATLCYRISALQVLLHNPKFIAWIEEEHPADKCASDNISSCVTCSLRCLVERYWSQSATREAINKVMTDLDLLFDKLGWKCGGANGQGDPNDHFLWILSQVEKDVDELAFRKLEATKCLLLNSTRACTLCGDMVINANIKEGLLSIYLTEPAKKKCGLVEYVAKYYNGEKIEGHRCDKCGKSSDKSRKFEIVHAPDVLTVQLCRFDSIGRKISTDVPYPEVLDLTPYLVNPSDQQEKYKLNGVITHQGGGTNAGHYRSIVKNPADGKWTLVDDSETTSCGLKAALQPKRGEHPFILSYLRIAEEA